MEPVAIVTALALIEFLFFGMATGKARVDTGVKAPATTGDIKFECYYRVQQNTLEQLVVLLPAMWMFAWYVHGLVAAGLGLVFVVARMVYFLAYIKDPRTREKPFIVGFLATVVLLLGGLVGAVLAI